MSLPLILGKAGKTSKRTVPNGSEVEAEFRWSDEDDQAEITNYTAVTAAEPATLRGPDDMAERSVSVHGHHEDAIQEVDVGHRGSERSSETTSLNAW